MSSSAFSLAHASVSMQDLVLKMLVPSSFTSAFQGLAATSALKVAYINYWEDTTEVEETPMFAPFGVPVNATEIITTLDATAFNVQPLAGQMPATAVFFLVVVGQPAQTPSAGRRLQQDSPDPPCADCMSDDPTQTATETCRLQPPVKDPLITSKYGIRSDPLPGMEGKMEFHTGLDFRASSGTVVYAAHVGRVTVRQGTSKRSFGYFITVTSTCQSSLYGHLQVGSAFVKDGDCVQPGTPLALSDNSGSSKDPHLHFQYSQNNKAVSLEGAILRDPYPCLFGQCYCNLQDYLSGACTPVSRERNPCGKNYPRSRSIPDPSDILCAAVATKVETTYVYNGPCRRLQQCGADFSCPDGEVCLDSGTVCQILGGSDYPANLCVIRADLAACGKSF